MQNHIVVLPTETMARGGVSEHRLVAELLERRHKVARPVVDDDGVDAIVNYTILVQVKSSIQQIGDSHFFHLGKPLRDHVDLLACHARDTGNWWFIPASLIPRDSKAIYLRTKPPVYSRRYGELYRWLNRWDLFASDALENALAA